MKSETSKRKAEYQKKQAKKAEKIILTILGCLIGLGVVFALWMSMMIA